jgi:hypothetical protein
MSEFITLKDKLSKDPFFRALFNQADSAQEAITVASAFGVNLSFADLMTFRKELRSMISKQSFHLDLARNFLILNYLLLYFIYFENHLIY